MSRVIPSVMLDIDYSRVVKPLPEGPISFVGTQTRRYTVYVVEADPDGEGEVVAVFPGTEWAEVVIEVKES